MRNILKKAICLSMMLSITSYASDIDITGLNGEVEIIASKSGKVEYSYDEKNVLMEERNNTVYFTSLNDNSNLEGNLQSFSHNGNIYNIAIGENAVSEMNLPNKQIINKNKSKKIIIHIPQNSNIKSSQVKGILRILAPVNSLKLLNISGDVMIESAKDVTLRVIGVGDVILKEASKLLDVELLDASELVVNYAKLNNLKILAKDSASVTVKRGVIGSMDVVTHDVASVILPKIIDGRIKKLEMNDASSIEVMLK